MSKKQRAFLFCCYLVLTALTFALHPYLKHHDVCYELVPGTQYSELTTGKHPSWKVVMQGKSSVDGKYHWVHINKGIAASGKYCTTYSLDRGAPLLLAITLTAIWLTWTGVFIFAYIIIGLCRIWNSLGDDAS